MQAAGFDVNEWPAVAAAKIFAGLLHAENIMQQSRRNAMKAEGTDAKQMAKAIASGARGFRHGTLPIGNCLRLFPNGTRLFRE
jgi:hypothetical protein